MAERIQRPNLYTAALLLLAALAAFFWSQDQAMLRLAPAGFSCWHHGLSSQPGLYADQPELLALAAAPERALEAEVTYGRRLEVAGSEWAHLFALAPAVIGRDCSELEGDLCSRVSPREEAWVNGLFYTPDEAPFSGLELGAGAGADYLYLRDDPDAEPLQLLRVPPGVREGKVEGCRWYYDNWQLPTRFAHPWRRFVPWLLGLGLLALFWGPLRRTAASLADRPEIVDPNLVNFRKRSARISLGITLAMLTGILGALLQDPQADYLPPLVFVGGFALVIAVITTAMLWRSALRQDRIFLGQALLARWEYPPEHWRRHLEAQFRERRAASRGLLLVVGVIMLLVGGGFVLALRDQAALIVAGVLLGVFLLLVLVAVVAPARRHQFLKSRPGLVLIAPSGVYLAGEFHDFRVFGSRLEGAEVGQKGANEVFLRIEYSVPEPRRPPVRHSRSPRSLRLRGGGAEGSGSAFPHFLSGAGAEFSDHGRR